MRKQLFVVVSKAQDADEGPIDHSYETAVRRASEITEESGEIHYVAQVVATVRPSEGVTVVDHRKGK